MTAPKHMLWMLDEYEKSICGHRAPGFITGQARGHGRLPGPHRGHGLRAGLHGARGPEGTQAQALDCVAAMQGFGNVCQYALRMFQKLGGKVICVSSWDQKDQKSYTFRKMSGVDATNCLASRTGSAASTRPRPRTWATRSCRATPGSNRKPTCSSVRLGEPDHRRQRGPDPQRVASSWRRAPTARPLRRPT